MPRRIRRSKEATRQSQIGNCGKPMDGHSRRPQPSSKHSAKNTKTVRTMKRYLIERNIPNVGSMSRAQFKDLAATSNAAIAKLSGRVQWVQSFIAADKTFCIYLAENEALVREHSQLAGFPITNITEVPTVLDPMTAYS